MFLLILQLALLFTGCSQPPSPPSSSWKIIEGRKSTPLYKIKIPNDWVSIASSSPLSDTRTPLASYQIPTQEGALFLTIHNFPDIHIPSYAQIERWKKQFTDLDETSLVLQPEAFGGFSGFYWEGSGKMDDKETTVLAWSMQLDPKLSQFLTGEGQSDFTIKVKGPKAAIDQVKENIIYTARSFGLIDEIPVP